MLLCPPFHKTVASGLAVPVDLVAEPAFLVDDLSELVVVKLVVDALGVAGVSAVAVLANFFLVRFVSHGEREWDRNGV
jgi:hypothetical protein